MPDEQISDRIEALVKEEHELLHRAESEHGLDDPGHARMREVQVELDQCWDLLRQRRALTEAGEDPGGARVRPASTVEGYRS
jgi:hypothetical protein